MAKSAKTTKKTPKSTAAKPNEMAEELLERHLAHELATFEPDAFVKWIQLELKGQFKTIKKIPLGQLVSADQVKQVIVRNVVENDIPGAIAEIAGDAATQLFSSDKHSNTPLNTLVSTDQIGELVDKLLEFPEQRKQVINHLIEMPIYQDLISSVLYQAILRYMVEENIVSKNVPGVSSMLKFGKRMIDKTVPKLQGAIEENVRAYIAGNLKFLLRQSKSLLQDSLTDDDIKTSAMELWETLENKTLGEFQQGVDSVDLSEFVVLGYEFWLRFRKSDYFKQAYELIVDYFFDVYGDSNLGILFDDLMISPERIMVEVEAFAPDLLTTLKHNGQIEAFLRRRLESFYYSESALECLQAREHQNKS